MFVLLLFIIALLSAGGILFTCNIAFWQAALLLLVIFIGLHAILAAVYLIAGLFVDLNKPIQKKSKFFLFGCWWISNICCTYGMISTKVTGKELLPEDSRFLMVSNHRSGFDPLIVMNKLKGYDIAFISKACNMTLPLVGKIAYAAGSLGIDRENDRNALKTILTAADYIKKNYCSMFVYPEGTRCKGEGMLPFHAGSFKIAQKANVPVVISVIRGTEQLKQNAFRRLTRTELEILEVVDAETVKGMSTTELAAYARKKIYFSLYGKEEENA